MQFLDVLRRMVDYRQFAELKSDAQAYWMQSGDVQVLPLLAMACLDLDERVSADKYLTEIERCKTAFDIDAQVDLAAVWILLWRVDEAMLLLDAALEQKPEHALALARRAWCWLQQGELEKARSLYQRSAKLVPGRIPIYTSLVSLHLEQDDIRAAQQALDAGITRLGEIFTELPETVVALNTTQLRELQLAIWVAEEDFARCDDWLDGKQAALAEDEWIG